MIKSVILKIFMERMRFFETATSSVQNLAGWANSGPWHHQSASSLSTANTNKHVRQCLVQRIPIQSRFPHAQMSVLSRSSLVYHATTQYTHEYAQESPLQSGTFTPAGDFVRHPLKIHIAGSSTRRLPHLFEGGQRIPNRECQQLWCPLQLLRKAVGPQHLSRNHLDPKRLNPKRESVAAHLEAGTSQL